MKNEFISRNNKKNTINLFFKKIRINIRNFLKLETLKFTSEIYEFLILGLEISMSQYVRIFFRAVFLFFEPRNSLLKLFIRRARISISQNIRKAFFEKI